MTESEFISSIARALLASRKVAKEREARRAAKQAIREMPLQELKESVATCAASYRTDAEAAHVRQLIQNEIEPWGEPQRGVLLDMLESEQKKQRKRMREWGFKTPRKAHRNRIALAERILKNKFGPLQPLFQFRYDAEVDSPMLAQHDGKYRCRCDCGRIVYKHKHHLLRSMDVPGHDIRSCGYDCGLRHDRIAKPMAPVASPTAAPTVITLPIQRPAESTNPVLAAFKHLHSPISDSGEASGVHTKGTSARGKE